MGITEYKDWQVKPWTTNFIVGRVLCGQRGSVGYRYTIFVGQWVDSWWEQFYRTLYGD